MTDCKHLEKHGALPGRKRVFHRPDTTPNVQLVLVSQTLRAWKSAHCSEESALSALAEAQHDYPGGNWTLLPAGHPKLGRLVEFSYLKVRHPRLILAIQRDAPQQPPKLNPWRRYE